MTFVSESEACKMWCPHAHVLRLESDPNDLKRDVIVGPANRDALGKSPNPIGSCRCIGSACMAWRWEAYRRPDDRSTSEPRGYCGAFGIPMESIV